MYNLVVTRNQRGVVFIPVLITVLILGIIGYFAYQNYQSEKEKTSSTQDVPRLTPETEKALKGEPAKLDESPIVQNPIDTSSWKNVSFELSRIELDKSMHEFTLTFTIPQNWIVVEKQRRNLEFPNRDIGQTSSENETVKYEIANYVISNPENTLTMFFNIVGGSAEWYPLPSNANLIDTFVPNPSGGSKIAWLLRYEDLNSQKMKYAIVGSDLEGNPLTVDDQITHWISIATDPPGGHDRGVVYTIEMTYTGEDKNYGINISTADQIISLLAGMDRN